MKDKFVMIFGALAPIAKEMLKKKGINIDNITFDDLLKHVNEVFKESEFFKTSPVQGKEKDVYHTNPVEDDSNIVSSEKNIEGIYTITINLPGYNKNNTELKYDSIKNIIQVIAKKQCDKTFRVDEITKYVALNELDNILSSKMEDGVLIIEICSNINKFEKITIN